MSATEMQLAKLERELYKAILVSDFRRADRLQSEKADLRLMQALASAWKVSA